MEICNRGRDYRLLSPHQERGYGCNKQREGDLKKIPTALRGVATSTLSAAVPNLPCETTMVCKDIKLHALDREGSDDLNECLSGERDA
jgi:hypothetical protein